MMVAVWQIVRAPLLTEVRQPVSLGTASLAADAQVCRWSGRVFRGLSMRELA